MDSINIGFDAKSSVINSVEKEFIFKFIIQNKINFEIIFNNKTALSTLLEQNPKDLEIEFPVLFEDFIVEGSEIEVVFYFLNNFHKFNSQVLKIFDNKAIIKNPEIITRNPQRKFERKQAKGKINVKFKIKGDLVLLEYPQSESSYYPSRPPIETDIFDVKIEKVIERFNKKISELVSDNKIKMLRSNKQLDYEEQMVVKYGKTLYIPDVYSDVPQKQLLPNFNIILKGDWIKFERLKNKTQPYLINKMISKYLVDQAQNNVFSKIITPILYRNYVVGLIYLINDLQKRESISLKILDYTYQFSKLVSYSLKQNNYFKEEELNTKIYSLPAFDFSPGGLSIVHNEDFFENKLLLNHNIDIILENNGNELHILAKVVRKIKKDFYNYGFMFIDITLQNHNKIIEMYNKI